MILIMFHCWHDINNLKLWKLVLISPTLFGEEISQEGVKDSKVYVKMETPQDAQVEATAPEVGHSLHDSHHVRNL